jgi:catechol 2,3-dioxygenase-like lactoylglutathione lyase family enzyme
MHALAAATLASLATATLLTALSEDQSAAQAAPLDLGNFSVSLTVKDIRASKAFYEKLDFQPVAGHVDQRWIVLQNGTTKIGLFQGMFERNSLTFNPGWNSKKETLAAFQDVRELQKTLKARGVKLEKEADESSTGPAYFSLLDPDGNPILVDQHVAKPKR